MQHVSSHVLTVADRCLTFDIAVASEERLAASRAYLRDVMHPQHLTDLMHLLYPTDQMILSCHEDLRKAWKKRECLRHAHRADASGNGVATVLERGPDRIQGGPLSGVPTVSGESNFASVQCWGTFLIAYLDGTNPCDYSTTGCKVVRLSRSVSFYETLKYSQNLEHIKCPSLLLCALVTYYIKTLCLLKKNGGHWRSSYDKLEWYHPWPLLWRRLLPMGSTAGPLLHYVYWGRAAK